MEKLEQKKKVYEVRKKGLATLEEYKNIVRACRDAVRKVKAHLELNLAREVKDNKKGLFLSISITKRRQGNEMGSLVQED